MILHDLWKHTYHFVLDCGKIGLFNHDLWKENAYHYVLGYGENVWKLIILVIGWSKEGF
jgi:hypothetical protein